MSADPAVLAVGTPGHIVFPDNGALADDLVRAGGHLVRRPTGHLVFYRPDGRRFLATDPAGHPLHECEWRTDAQGKTVMSRARLRLDWGAWVGVVAEGMINETTINLTTRPDWRRIRPEDLRAMAAQGLRVPQDDIRWFYRDEDFSISPSGQATIRHRKDALYYLPHADFNQASFMSCMGTMHWDNIDFLPVVELFKSLLPGTGTAVFELIRGLYDDQNEQRNNPAPLRYRGIPPYPSEGAFRLFSTFFSPVAPREGDAKSFFMDPARSDQIAWYPSSTPPLRYFDTTQKSCLTCKGSVLQKVTLADDPTGLPYVHPSNGRYVFCDRAASVSSGKVIACDRDHQIVIPATLPEQCRQDSVITRKVSPVDWRSVFVQGVPLISPQEAFSAVLLYPADEREIEEAAAQPFVADYIQDLVEQDREIGHVIASAHRILIDNGDAVIGTCIGFDRLRQYTVCVRVPQLAQRQAQQLWSVCAEHERWDWLKSIRFVPFGSEQDSAPYDLIYRWIPYDVANNLEAIGRFAQGIHSILTQGGHAFVIAPADLQIPLASAGLTAKWCKAVEQLPTFRMHRSVLPRARLKIGLRVYYVEKE